MGVIQTIRDKGGKITVFLIGFALLAFLLGDILTGNNSLLSGSRGNNTVGKIAGESIDVQEFERKVKEQEDIYLKNNPNGTIDDNTRESLREQVWNQLISEKVLEPQYQKLGFKVTGDEIFGLCTGADAHPAIKKAFTDPNTGQFDPNEVIRFFKRMDDDPKGEAKAQWISFEANLAKDRVREKYFAMAKAGSYVTSFEAKQILIDKDRKVDAKYVSQQYANIPDSTVKITDADKNAWYKKNLNKWKREDEVRKIEYVIFSVAPSGSDSQEVFSWAGNAYNGFKESTNDSIFVISNESVWDPTPKTKEQLDGPIRDTLPNAPIGSIFGPYVYNNEVRITKLINVKVDTNKTYHVRHILLKPKGNTASDSAATQKLANDIANNIRSKKFTFKQMSDSLSEDPGAKAGGGDLGEAGPGMMVKPFEDAAKNLPKDAITTCISQFGYHVIQAVDAPKTKYDRKPIVAVLSKPLAASPRTIDDNYNVANEFATSCSNYKEFVENARNKKFNVRVADDVKESEKTIAGLNKPKELITWAFQSKKGDVSPVFLIDDNYLVAALAEVKPEGFKKLDEVMTEVEEGVKKEKKAKMLIEKFNAELPKAKTPEDLAIAFRSVAQTVSGVSFSSSYLDYIGNDPAAVAAIITSPTAKFSKPVEGVNGVYVFYVTSITEAQLPANNNYSAQKQEKITELANMTEYDVFNALKEKGKVKDHRYKFY